MRVAFSDTIVLDKFLISPKLYMFIFHYPTLSVDISKLIKYYTDYHDVDEDRTTICDQGGYWNLNPAGVTCRILNDLFTDVFDTVASSNVKIL